MARNPWDPIRLKCHGGPYDGITIRHYPDHVETEAGKRYHFNDLEIDGGIYLMPDDLDPGNKICETYWKPT